MMLSPSVPGAAVEAEAALARAREGDADGFETLVREHQSMVFSLAYHFVGEAAAAEDVAQGVFLKLFRSLSSIESCAHLAQWLRRVAVHRCIDRFRKRRLELPLEGAAAERAAADPRRDVLFDERMAQLLRELPSHARAVMILRFQEDLDPRDIADVLGMPVNTVKSHIRRSVDTLRTRLGVKEAADARR